AHGRVPGAGGSRQVEPVRPPRVGGAVAEQAPGDALGRDRLDMQTPAELGWRTVALGVVAPGAGGYHVLPRVPAATAAREDVVYRLRRRLAVRAAPAVPGEDGPAGQPDVGAVGHPDVPAEPDHQRYR